MTYNFNEITDLLHVRDALRRLDDMLCYAKYNIESLSSFDDISETFKRFFYQASVFKNSSDYMLLKAYKTASGCINFFEPLSEEFFSALRRINPTVSTVCKIVKKIESAEKMVYDVLEDMQEKYFL